MTFPAPLPVFRVSVEETAPANRALPEHWALGLVLLACTAIGEGVLAWRFVVDARSLGAQPRIVVPLPALTTDQWMAGARRG